MEKAEEAITELSNLYSMSTTAEAESAEGECSRPELLEDMERQAIEEVRGHIMLQKRLCVGLLEMFYAGKYVNCMRVLDSIEDVTATTLMWSTILSMNPRMHRYGNLIDEADKSFSKFIGAIAVNGFIIVMSTIEGEQ